MAKAKEEAQAAKAKEAQAKAEADKAKEAKAKDRDKDKADKKAKTKEAQVKKNRKFVFLERERQRHVDTKQLEKLSPDEKQTNDIAELLTEYENLTTHIEELVPFFQTDNSEEIFDNLCVLWGELSKCFSNIILSKKKR